MTGGYNPLRWDCGRDGCFNKSRRPKIEAFADCFPGRINFGDVDGEVEINGCFCQIEWKGRGGTIATGQHIKFERYTAMRAGNVVFVVEGDAETMAVRRYRKYWAGLGHEWIAGDLAALKASIRAWAEMARAGRFSGRAA